MISHCPFDVLTIDTLTLSMQFIAKEFNTAESEISEAVKVRLKSIAP